MSDRCNTPAAVEERNARFATRAAISAAQFRPVAPGGSACSVRDRSQSIAKTSRSGPYRTSVDRGTSPDRRIGEYSRNARRAFPPARRVLSGTIAASRLIPGYNFLHFGGSSPSQARSPRLKRSTLSSIRCMRNARIVGVSRLRLLIRDDVSRTSIGQPDFGGT